VLAQSLLHQGKDGGDVLARLDQVDAGTPERVITAKLKALGLLLVGGENRSAEAEALLLQAEDETGDVVLRDDLRAVRATVLLLSAQHAKAMAIASDILRRPSANEGTCMRAAVVVVSCLAVAGRGDEAVAIAERWIELTRRASGALSLVSRSLLGFLLNLKALALLTGGRLHESEAVAKKEYQKNLAPLTHPWVAE